jgi:beta-glucosidase
MSKGLLFLLGAAALSSAAAQAYPDVEVFVKSLLANMTVEEKARQLVIQGGDGLFANGVFSSIKTKAYTRSLGAGVLDSMARNVDSRLYNQIQKIVVESSRHGIGAIFGDECQHGVQGDHHTIFPSPYTIAGTFDRDLMEQIGKVIGTEARAGGCSQCWAPVCGLAREPRWGRAEEEMGEDTYLAGELAASMVKGMTANKNLMLPTTAAPLLKHYGALCLFRFNRFCPLLAYSSLPARSLSRALCP